MPPYAYVPGGAYPHPSRDPAGHSYGRVKLPSEAPDPAHWESSRPYRYGIDLFNHGYYWEAHEAWEGLWHACGRQGTTADFLRALIVLAAACVKWREGVPGGVRRHAERSRALLESVTERLGQPRYLGLDLGALIEMSHRLAAGEAAAAEVLKVIPSRVLEG